MIFFMSRAKFEAYFAEFLDKIVRKYRLENNARLSEQADQMNGDISRLDETILELRQRMDDIRDNAEDRLQKIESELQSLEKGRHKQGEINPSDVDAVIAERITERLETLKADLKTELNSRINEVFAAESLETLKGDLRKEISNYINRVFNSYMNEVKTEIQQLKIYNANLESRIGRQDEELAELRKRVGSQDKEIEELRQALKDIKKKIFGEEVEPSTIPGNEQSVMIPVFGEDSDVNKDSLNNFLMQTRNLRTQIKAMFSGEEELGIYLKLVDKCINKFEKLIIKHGEKTFGSDKLANESAKILKQTVIRAMSQEKLKNCLEQYMHSCKVRKLNWKVGKVMENADYDYLEEPIFYDDVNDPKLNNAITEIRQDTYIIDYMEDDELQEAVISGIYSIGKYRS